MSWHRVVPQAALWGWLAWIGLTGEAEAAEPAPLAGWFGVFPELPGYQRSFRAPHVAAANPPTTYHQMARYEWTGGAVKLLDITLTRDPAIRQRYAKESLRREANAPRQVRVGQRTAWLWDLPPDPQAVRHRLVLPLADDQALILEARGAGPWEDLTILAGRFDLARLTSALGQPPRTAFSRTPAALRALKKDASRSDIEAWLGSADITTDADAPALTFRLPDGSRAVLELGNDQRLRRARHERADGKTDEFVR